MTAEQLVGDWERSVISYLTTTDLPRQQFLLGYWFVLYPKEIKALKFGEVSSVMDGQIVTSVDSLYRLELIKKQWAKDARTLVDGMRSEVHQMLLNAETLPIQKAEGETPLQRFLREQIKNRVEDWATRFQRMVATASHAAFEEGKALGIMVRSGESDPLVYKEPQATACAACVKAYLTNGFGSQPVVFTLSELRANGTNIGLARDQWKPTMGSLHPNCRCAIKYKPADWVWNASKGRFTRNLDK